MYRPDLWFDQLSLRKLYLTNFIFELVIINLEFLFRFLNKKINRMRKIIILFVTTIGSTIIQRNGASNENCIDFSLWKETGILKSVNFSSEKNVRIL